MPLACGGEMCIIPVRRFALVALIAWSTERGAELQCGKQLPCLPASRTDLCESTTFIHHCRHVEIEDNEFPFSRGCSFYEVRLATACTSMPRQALMHRSAPLVHP